MGMPEYENIVRWSNGRVDARMWIRRDPDGPTPELDSDVFGRLCRARIGLAGELDLMQAAIAIAADFDRTAALELLWSSTKTGVVLYPNWP